MQVGPEATNADPPVLRFQGAAVQRGDGRDAFRLEVPDTELRAGESVACIGPSGCGKTTLLHAGTGVLPLAAGRCMLAGRELSRMGDAERRRWRLRQVGMIFQEFALLEYLDAEENIILPARLAGLPLREARLRARELAGHLGIARFLRRRPARLSQGERQRVAICRALVARPRLLACDEPTGNLDPRRAAATIELLRARAAEIGAAMLVVTHDHGLLPRFDRVLDLDPARAATPGPPSPVASPSHPAPTASPGR